MAPTVFLLNKNDSHALQLFLWEKGHLDKDNSIVELASAGEGNMNCTLRVTTQSGSFVLKQSRPYVERYPQIAAPINRIHQEAEFYSIVRQNSLFKTYTPEVLWSDNENYLLALEDLGASSDFSFLYKKGVVVSSKDILSIAKVLSELHFRFNENTITERISNMEMRKLNHEHIFKLPLQEHNGIDLDAHCAGLQAATVKYRQDDRLKEVADELGSIYLEANGTTLIHGDYYPGSWLKTAKGFRIIDPEFCFFGRPEFELGVAVAHLKMAQQPDALIKDLFIYYHFDKQFDGSLFTKFAGIEIIRRLIGVAQLPLELTLQERLDLLEEARSLVVKG